MIGWGLSLVLAYGIGGLLEAAGIVLSLPLLGLGHGDDGDRDLDPDPQGPRRDAHRVGDVHPSAPERWGSSGRSSFITLILSTTHPLHEAVILLAFVVLAVLLALVAVRSMFKGWPLLERTFETSSQLAVRFAVVLVFGLVALASELDSTCCWAGLSPA